MCHQNRTAVVVFPGRALFAMSVALVAEVLATISEESFSLEHMIVHRDSYDLENANETKNEFDQYVELMTEIKKSSEKSKAAIETILNDSENLKFANSRLADYGDLVKRVERLNSVVDELEYKVSLYFSDFFSELILDRNE
jgi:predicted nuclease with TOPRIM domain